MADDVTQNDTQVVTTPQTQASGDPQVDWRQMLSREVSKARADLQGQVEEWEKKYTRLSNKYEKELGEWESKYKQLEGTHNEALTDFAWMGATAPYGLDEETLDIARHRYGKFQPVASEDGKEPSKPSVSEWFAQEVESRPAYLSPFLPQEKKEETVQPDRPWKRVLPQINRSVTPPQPPMPSSGQPDWKHMSKEEIVAELKRQGK